jgi:hypothetical protein
MDTWIKLRQWVSMLKTELLIYGVKNALPCAILPKI